MYDDLMDKDNTTAMGLLGSRYPYPRLVGAVARHQETEVPNHDGAKTNSVITRLT